MSWPVTAPDQCRLCGGVGIRPVRPGSDRNWRKCRRCKGSGMDPQPARERIE